MQTGLVSHINMKHHTQCMTVIYGNAITPQLSKIPAFASNAVIRDIHPSISKFTKYTEERLNGLYHRMPRAYAINPSKLFQWFGSINNFHKEVSKKRNM